MTTYAYNDKVQTSPGFGKVSPEPKRDPLEYHLYEKQHRKDHINYLEYKHEFFIVLKIDVLKTQGETGCKDEKQDGPLEKRVINNIMDKLSDGCPTSAQARIAQKRKTRAAEMIN